MDQKSKTWAQRWDAFTRRHPLVYFALVWGLALLTGPLLIAATRATAVLYKDF